MEKNFSLSGSVHKCSKRTWLIAIPVSGDSTLTDTDYGLGSTTSKASFPLRWISMRQAPAFHITILVVYPGVTNDIAPLFGSCVIEGPENLVWFFLSAANVS
jgi:hypothetical protein